MAPRKKQPPKPKKMAKNIVDVFVEDRIEFCNDLYSTAANIRAIGDFRDGLKPVHRRILFAMHKLRCTPDQPYVKSARVVGDVIGKYHPHGDTSVYDAAVKLSQDFYCRYPLIDGQGNLGYQSGDSQAAMRYTEMRLTKLATSLLTNIFADVLPMTPNYDQKLLEPAILYSKVPLLLMNGSVGIGFGSGGHTAIPPHNLKEVTDAIVHVIDCEISGDVVEIDDLLKYIKGPDLPTGGTILSSSENLKEMYETGSAQLINRATYSIEGIDKKTDLLRFTSIPYLVEGNEIIKQISQVFKSGQLNRVRDFNDMSSLDDGISFEFMVDKGYGETIASVLFQKTSLSKNFNAYFKSMNSENQKDPFALNDDKELPLTQQKFNLVDYIHNFLYFNRRISINIFNKEVEKLNLDIDKLSGLLKVLVDLDEAIKIIRSSQTRQAASLALQDHFDLNEVQADYILEIKLSALVKKSMVEIKKSLRELKKRLKYVKGLLSSKEKMWNYIKDDLISISDEFSDDRRTLIQHTDSLKGLKIKEVRLDEPSVIILSKLGFLKRMKTVPQSEKYMPGDSRQVLLEATTLSSIAFFTDMGKVYILEADKIPPSTSNSKGTLISSIFNMLDEENIIEVVALKPGLNMVIQSRLGNIFKFKVDEKWLQETKKAGKYYAKPMSGDSIMYLGLFEPEINLDEMYVRVISEAGYAIKYSLSGVSWFTSASKGNKSIKMLPGQEIIYMDIVTEEDMNTMISVSGRKIKSGRIRVTGKSVRGIKVL